MRMNTIDNSFKLHGQKSNVSFFGFADLEFNDLIDNTKPGSTTLTFLQKKKLIQLTYKAFSYKHDGDMLGERAVNPVNVTNVNAVETLETNNSSSLARPEKRRLAEFIEKLFHQTGETKRLSSFPQVRKANARPCLRIRT